MYCTPLHLQKRTVYRGLALALLMALLFQWALPSLGGAVGDEVRFPRPSQFMTEAVRQPIVEVWDEGLVPWRSKRLTLTTGQS